MYYPAAGVPGQATEVPCERSQRAPDAADPIVIVHGPALTSYNFSDEHPLQPSRHGLTMSLLSSSGGWTPPGCRVEAPRPATLSELLTAHTLPFVQAVQTAQAIARGERPAADLRLYGLGTEDDPLFPGIHEAPALLAGASLQAMQALLDGRAVHAYSPAGGMHHAMRARAAGFCIYNDIAVAIAAAVEAGLRVAYVDLDAHHGDGVQAAFYDDPRVLTVSMHESGRFLFPGTGDATEMGAGDGVGACLNIPLAARRGRRVHPSGVRTDSHRAGACGPSPRTSSSPRPAATPTTPTPSPTWRHHGPVPGTGGPLHELVHEVCAGRWLIVGGGGYDPADVTPRAWTAFFGTVLGRQPKSVVLPAEWRQASRAKGGDPPAHLLDDAGAAFAQPPGPPSLGSLDEIEAGSAALGRSRANEVRKRNKGAAAILHSTLRLCLYCTARKS